MLKYSKQHAAILNFLQTHKTHPTAAEIYEGVKKEIPNISLGTVYRNLNNMAKSGEIAVITFAENEVHYDADTSGHLHLHCVECGKTQDACISDTAMFCTALSEGFKPESSVNIIYGRCRECQNKNLK